MAEKRTVTIHMDAVQQTMMRQATDPAEWRNAIGYLATWNMSFPIVDIYAVGEKNMLAIYLEEEGLRNVIIGAEWKDDHYDFKRRCNFDAEEKDDLDFDEPAPGDERTPGM